MSLAGLVPPMTDGGDMLCDGGYVDNLPVSTIRSMGANIILAVDVGSVDDRIEMTYGRYHDKFENETLTGQVTHYLDFGLY